MPTAWYDETAALMSTDQGTLFETLFGTVIADFQGAGVNRSYRIDGFEVAGFVIDTSPTTAAVVNRFQNGRPAITEARFGQGTAVVLGYEASRMCFWQGSRRAQTMLLRYTLGGYGAPYSCSWEPHHPPGGAAPRGLAGATQPIIYRLAAPAADHYFVINEGAAKQVTLNTKLTYKQLSDAVTGRELKLGARFLVGQDSGRWLRAIK
jgi:beta-galactosidase